MQKTEDIATLIDRAVNILEDLRNLNDQNSDPDIETALGNDIISVIWVSCAGLSALAKELGASRVDKISTTTECNLSSRLAILGRDQYGATIRDANGRTRTQSGYQRWIAQAIHVTRPAVEPGIRVRTRSIAFDRPSTMTRRCFDTELRRELGEWTLEHRYPSAKRYTDYKDLARLSRATEFVVGLDPRTDGDKLLESIERILARHRRRQAGVGGRP
ncbi:MAG: hypothetical protein OTI36_15170 [Beijerinckiaceae bacterium]|nr:hypothetical protein [Beijerinckiaceae bacterium]